MTLVFSDDFVSNCSIYSGHHSILIPPSEVEANPALWLTAVSQYRVRDTFCSYGEYLICSQNHLRELFSLTSNMLESCIIQNNLTLKKL